MLRSSAAVTLVSERYGVRPKPPASSGGTLLFGRARAIVSLVPWGHAGFRRGPARCGSSAGGCAAFSAGRR